MNTHWLVNKKPTLSMRTLVPAEPVVIVTGHDIVTDSRYLYTSSKHLIHSLLKLRKNKGHIKTSYEMAEFLDALVRHTTVVDVDSRLYKVRLYRVLVDVYELNDLL